MVSTNELTTNSIVFANDEKFSTSMMSFIPEIEPYIYAPFGKLCTPMIIGKMFEYVINDRKNVSFEVVGAGFDTSVHSITGALLHIAYETDGIPTGGKKLRTSWKREIFHDKVGKLHREVFKFNIDGNTFLISKEEFIKLYYKLKLVLA